MSLIGVFGEALVAFMRTMFSQDGDYSFADEYRAQLVANMTATVVSIGVGTVLKYGYMVWRKIPKVTPQLRALEAIGALATVISSLSYFELGWYKQYGVLGWHGGADEGTGKAVDYVDAFSNAIAFSVV